MCDRTKAHVCVTGLRRPARGPLKTSTSERCPTSSCGRSACGPRAPSAACGDTSPSSWSARFAGLPCHAAMLYCHAAAMPRCLTVLSCCLSVLPCCCHAMPPCCTAMLLPCHAALLYCHAVLFWHKVLWPPIRQLCVCYPPPPPPAPHSCLTLPQVKGMYASFLPAWLSVFPRSRFLILRNEDYQAAPQEHMVATISFLGRCDMCILHHRPLTLGALGDLKTGCRNTWWLPSASSVGVTFAALSRVGAPGPGPRALGSGPWTLVGPRPGPRWVGDPDSPGS